MPADSRWYAATKSIADQDAYHQPILPHMEWAPNTTAANSWWKSQPYHSGWAVQWQGDVTGISTAKTFWNSSPAKPSVLYESAYDAFWADSRGTLGAAYKAFQYGMYGYGYGTAGVWNDNYSAPREPADYGGDYEMPERYLWWFHGANLQTANLLTYFKGFYTAFPWWNLVPCFSDAAWASFLDAHHSLLSSDGQNTCVVFFYGSGTRTGTLKNMPDSTYYAKWFDPRTGAYTVLSDFLPSNHPWTIPLRPDASDWVLLVRRGSGGQKSANLAIGASPTASETDTANGYSSTLAIDGIKDGGWNGWAIAAAFLSGF